MLASSVSTEPFLNLRQGSARINFSDVPKRCRAVRGLKTSSPLGRGSSAGGACAANMHLFVTAGADEVLANIHATAAGVHLRCRRCLCLLLYSCSFCPACVPPPLLLVSAAMAYRAT